jgi:hypothetical protein
MVKILLRLEGLVILLLSLYFYNYLHASWLVFMVLLFIPDVSMIGYLRNKEIGAIVYNLGHNYILGMGVILTGLAIQNTTLLSLGLILTSHMGIDRALGFGLKYKTGFNYTHLQKI